MSDLYVAPDAHDDPTIWQRTSSALGDRALLTRTATNAPAFDALAAILPPAHVHEWEDVGRGSGAFVFTCACGAWWGTA